MDYLSHTHTSKFFSRNINGRLLQVLTSVFNNSNSANVKQKIAVIAAWWSRVDDVFADFYERLDNEGYRSDGKSRFEGGFGSQQGTGGFDFQSGWGSSQSQPKIEKPAGVVRIEGQLDVLEERVETVEKGIRSGNIGQQHKELLQGLKESQSKLKELEQKLTSFPDVLENVKRLDKRIAKVLISSSQSGSKQSGFNDFNFGPSNSSQKQEDSKFEFDWGGNNSKQKPRKEPVQFSAGGGNEFNSAFNNQSADFFSDISFKGAKNEKTELQFEFGDSKPTKSKPQAASNDFWGGAELKQEKKPSKDIWDSQENTFSFQTGSQSKTKFNDFDTKVADKNTDIWGKQVRAPEAPTKKAGIWDAHDDESSEEENTGYKPPLDDPFKEMEEEQAKNGFDYFSGTFGQAGSNTKVGASSTVNSKPSQIADPFTNFDMDNEKPEFSRQSPAPIQQDTAVDLLGFGEAPAQLPPVKKDPVVFSPQLENTGGDIDLIDLSSTPSQPQSHPQSPPQPISNYDILNTAQPQVNLQMTGGMYGMPMGHANPFAGSPGLIPQAAMGNYVMPGMQGYGQQFPMGHPMAMGSYPGSPMMMQGQHPMQMQGVYMMNPMMGMHTGPSMGYSGHHTPSQMQTSTLGSSLGASNTITFSQPQTPSQGQTSPSTKAGEKDPFGDLAGDLI